MIKNVKNKWPKWLVPLCLGVLLLAALISVTCFAGLFSPFRKEAKDTVATPVETREDAAKLSYRVTTSPEPKTEEETEGSSDTEPVTTVSEGEPMVQVFPTADLCLDVSVVYQLPELPNGCEVTALATVLAYYGLKADKTDLADCYLPKCELLKGNPYECYIGDPSYKKAGFGCYADAICKTAAGYLKAVGSGTLVAQNVSGKSVAELAQAYVKNGTPVILWGTVQMEYREDIIDQWDFGGVHYKWYKYSHCLVLIGYNSEYYWFADPLSGIVSYPKTAVERCYGLLNQQAVVLTKVKAEK